MGNLKSKTTVQWCVVVVLVAICLLIPEQGFYTHQFKLFMAITVFGLALSAFELVPLLFVSFVMPCLWIALGVTSAEVVMSPWLGTTFLMFPGVFVLATSMEECGLLRRVAYFLLTKLKGSYFGLLVSIMIVGVVLNIFTSGNGYVITAALAFGLCKSLDGMNKKLGVGLASAVMIGGCTSHIYTYQVGGWAVIKAMGASYFDVSAVTPLSLLLHNWPMFFISILIVWIISKWYKPEEDLGNVDYFDNQLKEMGSITRREIVNLIVLTILMVYIFTVGIHGFDLNLGFALIPWLLFLPGVNGADANTVKKVDLSIIFFVAVCMSIGTVAGSLGMGELIAGLCSMLMNGSENAIVIMAGMFVVVFVLNFLMTPMAIFALLIGPACIMAMEAGFNPLPFVYAVNACSEAIILPYEYIPYLVVFSFGMMSMKDFIKTNILRSALVFAGFLLIMVPYWKVIGLF